MSVEHIKRALVEYIAINPGMAKFIRIEASLNPLIAPTVTFKMQHNSVAEVGTVGLQTTDMIAFIVAYVNELNKAFPCEENLQTILSLKQAIEHQESRTSDRKARGVEGKHEL